MERAATAANCRRSTRFLHRCGETCGTGKLPAKPALSSPVSTHCRSLEMLLSSRLPRTGEEWYERRGLPNRADCGDPVERGSRSAQGGSQRDDIPHVVRGG